MFKAAAVLLLVLTVAGEAHGSGRTLLGPMAAKSDNSANAASQWGGDPGRGGPGGGWGGPGGPGGGWGGGGGWRGGGGGNWGRPGMGNNWGNGGGGGMGVMGRPGGDWGRPGWGGGGGGNGAAWADSSALAAGTRPGWGQRPGWGGRNPGGDWSSAAATAAAVQQQPGWGSPGGRPGAMPGLGAGIRRYDRSYLTGLVPSAPPRASRPMGPLSSDAAAWSESVASADSSALAQDMVGGVAARRSDAIAAGIVDAAARGRRNRIAEAMANAAAMNRGATASLLSRSATYAAARGEWGSFADATAEAFAASRRRGSAGSLGLAVADAVSQGGADGQYAYGQAIARAVAGGGDGQAAVAEATAKVFCSGDSYASAWSSAFAVALNQDQNGCLVLSNARAMATASCGGGAFNAKSESDATSKVLGFCGLLPPGLVPGFSFNSNDSGSNSWQG